MSVRTISVVNASKSDEVSRKKYDVTLKKEYSGKLSGKSVHLQVDFIGPITAEVSCHEIH